MPGKINTSFYEHIALFPLFTICSAYLATLFWGESIPAFITSDWVFYTGLSLLVVSVVLKLMTKLHFFHVYDVFLVGCLLIWVVFWQQEYTFQAPVFRAFSLYFVLINLLFGKFARNEVFDEDQYQLLDFLSRKVVFQPIFLAICVLLGLYLQTWYMLFPTFISMFMIGILIMRWKETVNAGY